MGGRRNCRAERCQSCRMHRGLCICALVPVIRTRSLWFFVQHASEQGKTTGTGALAHRALAGSRLCLFRGRSEPTEPPLLLPADRPAFLLFPPRPARAAPDSPGVERGIESSDPSLGSRMADSAHPDALAGLDVSIVVPDGTWSQVRKIVRGVPELGGLPRVRLPDEARARWSLRRETSPGGMSTVDAVCWLLAALEGPLVAAPLEEAARQMWLRTVASRGMEAETER